MIYLILSLIVGLSAALIVWAMFLIEKDLSPNTLRRLDKIKRKSNSEASDSQYELDISLENIEYKIQAMGVFLKDFKFTKTIKGLIKSADVDLYVDTFIFLSLLCSVPFWSFWLHL